MHGLAKGKGRSSQIQHCLFPTWTLAGALATVETLVEALTERGEAGVGLRQLRIHPRCRYLRRDWFIGDDSGHDSLVDSNSASCSRLQPPG